MFRQSALRFFVLVLCWSGVSSSAMPADPPRAAELIKQLTTALDQEKSAEDLGWVRSKLAEALGLAGEYGSAKQQADRCTGDLKAHAHRWIWETELARGLNPPLPTKPAENPQAKAADTFTPETYTRALERAGRSADVDRLLLMLDGSIASTYARIEALLFMVEDHLAAGRLPQARRRLDQAIAQFPHYVKNRLRTEWFERSMKAAFALGAKDLAASLRDQFSKQLESRSQGRSVGDTVPSDWSALGLWSFQIGEPAKGETAFARALKDLQSAANDKDSVWRDPRSRLGALATIAVRQFEAGLKREATESTSKILSESDQIAVGSRGFTLRSIAARLVDAGDFDDALLVLARNPSAYYRVLTSVDLARQAINLNDHALAKTRLISAGELVDKIEKPDEHWHALLEIAEVSATAGDREGASKLFSEAAAIIARQEEQTGFQNLARGMIRAGFLAEAYETIGRVPKPKDRLLPLAELTLETARREFPLPGVKR